jgi:YfiH family protein
VSALRVPLLDACGVEHAFGLRDVAPPAGVLRPVQVHGAQVAEPDASNRLVPEEADAVVSTRPGLAVGVLTADCVPILAASHNGAAVAAIHAGWRGLAAGVVEAGMARLEQRAAGEPLVAAIGPRIGLCCYEVDDPVIRAFAQRFGVEHARALVPTRAGHARVDLGWLVALELERVGLPPDRIGLLDDSCTRCHAEKFHSHRRDGAAAGRLVHYVAACR